MRDSKEVKTQDFVGRTFGFLTVLERVPDYVAPSGQRYPKWRCQCRCGNVVEVLGYQMKRGGVISCGCARTRDISGETFGDLRVLRISKERSAKGDHLWECQCTCGNIVLKTREQITKSRNKTCGDCQSYGFENLAGREFGLWTVLSKIPNTGKGGKGRAMWLCRCQCGTVRPVGETQLTRGRSHSCGCIIGHDPTKKRQPAKSRIGERLMMNCGVNATIVAARGFLDIDIQFEDGEVKRGVSYAVFCKRRIAHPQWHRRSPKEGQYRGFTEVRWVHSLPNAVYYSCKRPDGAKDILTPQQMMAWGDGEALPQQGADAAEKQSASLDSAANDAQAGRKGDKDE